MKRINSVLLAIALTTVSTPISAQDETVAVETAIFSQLPPEIRSIIDNSNPVTILSVDGKEVPDKNYVYVDELILQKNSSIVFENLEVPFFAVIAKRVRVVDGASPFSILRTSTTASLDGDDGGDGPTGSRGGRSGKHGVSGSNGKSAGNGSPGGSLDVPPVYIVFGTLEEASSGDPLSTWNLSYEFNGLVGGNGGDGGDGGAGGKGGSGERWKSGFPGNFCRSGPGRGGNGANGGNGGNGAKGGNGGNGAAITFFGVQPLVDVLSLGAINNYGAEPGKAGKAGKAGLAGKGGNSGSSGNCGPRDNGKNGRNGASGKDGEENTVSGQRGEVVAYIAPSPGDLF